MKAYALLLLSGCEELEPVAIGIAEVDAMGIVAATAHFYLRRLQDRSHLLVLAGFQPQGHVIHLASAGDLGTIAGLKESHHLGSAAEETLPGVLMGHLHAQKIRVEFPCTAKVADIEDNMINAAHFQRGLAHGHLLS